MSWNLLERFLESELFNKDPSLCIQYLARYSGHLGIQYALCTKLRQFSYEELEFVLPQLCQLLVSTDNDSMALEEFIFDLCEESVNAALLTFWLFQTYLNDLSSNPQSVYFRTTSRIYNKVQRIIFEGSDIMFRDRIKENVLPVTVLASLVLTSVAAPWLPVHAGPLAVAQARRPRPIEDVISEAGQVQRVSRSQTVAGEARRPRRKDLIRSDSLHSEGRRSQRGEKSHAQNTTEDRPKPRRTRSPASRTVSSTTVASAAITATRQRDINPGSSSDKISTPPASAGPAHMHGDWPGRRKQHATPARSPSALSRDQKVRLLRSNYFRTETAFLAALEDIANRLVSVPKAARLSALRAELALIAQDLPAEVDIPVICPATLDDGQPSKSRHHRIVRLNPAEATSLNSAERVPYLLMVEVLREDFDFNPDSEDNIRLLHKLLQEEKPTKRRLFDLSDASRVTEKEPNLEVEGDSVLEPTNGDLGNASLLGGTSTHSTETAEPAAANGLPKAPISRPSQSASILNRTPRSSTTELIRSDSPAPRNAGMSRGPDQPDVSALATHMRTAAQMLAQLDQSGSKRPKTEVAAIKAKIIASMQSLEEQSFLMDDPSNPPTFDTIMAKGDQPDVRFQEDGDLDAQAESTVNSGAGAARMENDQKTGGVRRRGDPDDPSAATFGEEWTSKKERIRRSSPFGWMPNWDLVSVIVKTGADLRQEAFASQLIRVCAKIWEAADVPVWVKEMRILVTGEGSGLIETITNGVSLHSLKRSLTLSAAAETAGRPKRIATLKDHFVKTFGEEGSEAYAAGVDAFTRSLAAYSIISYVLQLKDRHNGNILIDNAGHIVHIDFGFMLSNSPGSMGFEAAPFKLPYEYVDVLGGLHGERFDAFKALCRQAFWALRMEADALVTLVEIMGRESRMPCFANGGSMAANALRARFVLHLGREEVDGFVDELVGKSAGSYYTRLYDTFQYRTQGIY